MAVFSFSCIGKCENKMVSCFIKKKKEEAKVTLILCCVGTSKALGDLPDPIGAMKA